MVSTVKPSTQERLISWNILILKTAEPRLIIGLVALFSIFALWLRLLPMLNMGNTDVLMMVASDDPLYNLRQVEQILANFPNYAWFDPMSLFPTGHASSLGAPFPDNYCNYSASLPVPQPDRRLSAQVF